MVEENFAGNIIINLASLPDFLRNPILKKRMIEFFSLSEPEKKGWSEFGTVTGRQRRAADFDFNLARRAIMLNGATQISITKLDVLYTDCAGETLFDNLSKEAKAFIKNIEDELNTPVTIIGTGPDTNDVIDRRS